jgi:hypothetical protein
MRGMPDNRYIVIRTPCLPEDEGRYFVIRGFEKREQAEKWIGKQEGKYFNPSDYIIAEI